MVMLYTVMRKTSCTYWGERNSRRVPLSCLDTCRYGCIRTAHHQFTNLCCCWLRFSGPTKKSGANNYTSTDQEFDDKSRNRGGRGGRGDRGGRGGGRGGANRKDDRKSRNGYVKSQHRVQHQGWGSVFFLIGIYWLGGLSRSCCC